MSKQKPTPIFRRLVRYVKPYSFWVAVTVIASLALAAIDILLGKFIERMVGGGVGSPVEILTLIAGMVLIGMPCRYLIKYASARFSVKALQDLRGELIDTISGLPVGSVERKFSGDLVSRLTNDTGVLQNFFIQNFSNLFYQPVVFVGALTILILTSWKLVLGSLVLLPIGLIFAGLLTKPMEKYSKQLQEKIGDLNALAQEAIGGMAIIKAFNMQAAFFQKYRLLMEQVISQNLRIERRYAYLAPIGILLMTTPIVFVIVYGGHLIGTGELDAGGVVLFLYLLTFVLQPVAVMPQLAAQIREASGAASRLFEVMDWPAERQGGESIPAVAHDGQVEFDGVTFSYDGESKVLDGVSFTLNQGETVAIVGASGGGKSTLLKLLCGFYELEEGGGSIRVFGKPVSGWDLTELRTQMSMVTQESYLFPGTIEENIGYGKPDATRDKIVEAAKSAQAHDFIMGLPQGYGTVLGERGGGLSGGQKQRIAIARALLKGAPLLLLDEPTSALDTQSEALVQAALRGLMENRSVLVIAHRLSTIMHADRIVVLDGGRVAEIGTHQELLNLGGVYERLFLRRFSAEDNAADTEERGEKHVLQASLS